MVTEINIKISQKYKLENIEASRLVKTEYKSSSATELAGGRYHMPI